MKLTSCLLISSLLGTASGVLLGPEGKSNSSPQEKLREITQNKLWNKEELAAHDFEGHFLRVEFDRKSDPSSIEKMADSLTEAGFKIRQKLVRRTKMLAVAAPSKAKADAFTELVDRQSEKLGLKLASEISEDAIFTVTTELADVDLWNLDRLNEETLTLDGDMSYDGTGVGTNIFILDTGIDFEHQEFVGKTGGNIWDSYDSTLEDDNDVYGHGTHCAGTAAGMNVGIAPGAGLYGMKVLGDSGSGYYSDIVAAIEHVIDLYEGSDPEFAGVNSVISMSLGGGVDSSLNNAVRDAFEAGILVVTSAGNGNKDNSCDYSPASAAKSLSVGATDSSDNVAYFSSTGPCVNTFAPGQDIDSACNSNTAGPWGCGDNDSYIALSGTSMSAPLVAGLAALYWEKKPDFAVQKIARGIQKFSHDDLLDTSGSWSGTENRLANGVFV